MADLMVLFSFCRDDICSVWIECIVQYGPVQCAKGEDECENTTSMIPSPTIFKCYAILQNPIETNLAVSHFRYNKVKKSMQAE